MKIRIFGLAKESIVDGNGIRFAIFAQGCKHNCKGCHNPESHDLDAGTEMDCDEIIEQIAENPLLSGVTFSGGEPFLQVEPLLYIAKRIRPMGLGLIIYTGFVFETLMKMSQTQPMIRELIELSDNIIDGKYMEEKRNLTLRFRGSENQRVIDVKKTLETGTVVTTEL